MTDHSTSETFRDVIIIGGGCAGLAAALYTKRYELKTLVIAKELGGLITTTHIVENYPGIKPMSGWDMMEIFLEQMKMFEVEMLERPVVSVERKEDMLFHVCTDDACFEAKTVIFATGTHHKELGAPGEQEYKNKGVSYCATCDGPLFRGQPMIIVGGGDSAAKEALLLSDYASHVYVIARSTLKAEPINAHRITQKDNITVLEGTEVSEIHGDDEKVTHVTITKEHNGSNTIEAGAVFIAIGHLAQTDLVKDLGVDMNPKGEILIDKQSRTNLPGFYAAGDCTDTAWKQAIISAAEGSQAANSAYEDITGGRVQTK